MKGTYLSSTEVLVEGRQTGVWRVLDSASHPSKITGLRAATLDSKIFIFGKKINFTPIHHPLFSL